MLFMSVSSKWNYCYLSHPIQTFLFLSLFLKYTVFLKCVSLISFTPKAFLYFETERPLLIQGFPGSPLPYVIFLWLKLPVSFICVFWLFTTSYHDPCYVYVCELTTQAIFMALLFPWQKFWLIWMGHHIPSYIVSSWNNHFHCSPQ